MNYLKLVTHDGVCVIPADKITRISVTTIPENCARISKDNRIVSFVHLSIIYGFQEQRKWDDFYIVINQEELDTKEDIELKAAHTVTEAIRTNCPIYLVGKYEISGLCK